MKNLLKKYLKKKGFISKSDLKYYTDVNLSFINSFISNYFLLLKKKEISIIHVGCHRLLSGDPLRIFYETNYKNCKAVLIDGIKENIEYLKKNKNYYKNFTFLNCVIGNKKKQYFYKFSKKFYEYAKKHKLNFNDGLSSFSDKNLREYLKNNFDLSDLDYIDSLEVEPISIDKIIKIHFNNENIDFLQIDAEGYDDDIIYSANLEKNNINFINFESKHLGVKKEKIFNYLKKNNFSILEYSKSDALAFKKIL